MASHDEYEKRHLAAELNLISNGLETSSEHVALRDRVPRIHHDMPLIWIDAVFINQNDLVERIDQVNLVRDIYKRAKSLAVWLGVKADDSSRAVSLLKQIQPDLPQFQDRKAYFRTKSLESGVQDASYAIWKLFSRSWFCGLWIVQEYVLGGHSDLPEQSLDSQVLLCCGEDRIQALLALGSDILDELSASPKLTDIHTDLPSARMNSIVLLRNHVILEKTTGNTRQCRNGLLSVIILSSTAYATDPRDRIYACIGWLKKFSMVPLSVWITIL